MTVTANPTGIPEEVLVGKRDGKWALEVFTTEADAIEWLRAPQRATTALDALERRRVWRCRLTVAEELELVAPAPYLQSRANQ